jgi:probable HAF family extracellular repeat protein
MLSTDPLYSQIVSTQQTAVPTYSVMDLGLGDAVGGISNAGVVAAHDAAFDDVLYWTDGSNDIANLTLDPRAPAVCGLMPPYDPLAVAVGGISRNGLVVVTVIPNATGDDFFGTHCVAIYNSNTGAWTFNRTVENGGAIGINNSGQITGNGFSGFGPSSCDFSTRRISAGAINDAGQVAGDDGYPPYDMLLCVNGVWKTLVPNSNVGPTFMNNKGQIVGGQYVNDSSELHAFLYSDGKLTDISPLSGRPIFSFPASINQGGQVTGVTLIFTSDTSVSVMSFLYQDGVNYDLNTLVSPSDPHKGKIQLDGDAYINDKGVIATSGTSSDGFSHLYVLTPIKKK